jgi:hypothetical protein
MLFLLGRRESDRISGRGLLEEEREALLQAMSWVARALAVENHIAEPENLLIILKYRDTEMSSSSGGEARE